MKKLKIPRCFLSGIFLFLGIGSTVLAQEREEYVNTEPQTRFWDRVYTGGNVMVQFGINTLVDISPLVGYRITDKLSAGIGATYLYYRYKDNFINFSTHVYGGRLFSRYFITDNFFSHAEYELLNLEQFDVPKKRTNVNSVLAGLGYSQPIGASASFNILVLWNFTPSRYTPYANPVIRAGFNVGL